MQNQSIEYDQNLDTSEARVVEPKIIKKLRERKQEVILMSLDMEVLNWMNDQDQDTKKRINDVLRNIMLMHPKHV